MKPLVLAFTTVLAFAATFARAQNRPGLGDVEITLSGTIDGSDEFHFTPGKIAWTHKHWKEPADMKFAGAPWNKLEQTPQDWRDFRDLNLSKARIVKRKGRDTVALEVTRDGFVLYFCDSPNGGDDYSVTIAIPRR